MKNEHKELYLKFFPQYIIDHLEHPRNLNTEINKARFIMCTKACIQDYDSYHRALYHTLYLTFVY